MLILYYSLILEGGIYLLMNNNEIRFRVSDLTYSKLKSLSDKIGIPITKVVKNIVISKLVEMKEGIKK